MKIALVHDDLVQWGGAERVLFTLSEIFPETPIYTSVYDKNNTLIKQHFDNKQIITSFIQKIPCWRNLYKALLPLYPLAFEQFDFSGFDVVLSQTTRFAKSIITKPNTLHICYCHTPPRFLWNFSKNTIPSVLNLYLSFLRIYDQIASSRVDIWIAGSLNAQQKIQKVYKSASKVIYPFVDLERFNKVKSFDGGYLLVISRLVSYKRVDLVIDVCNKLKIPLKIIGVGSEEDYLKRAAGPTVEFLGLLDEDILINLLAGCKALVIAGEEDFGLTALEAQALGKPVIAYKKGGVLETIIEGETGYFFSEQNIASLIAAIEILDKKGYNQERCFIGAQKFSKEKFSKQLQDFIYNL